MTWPVTGAMVLSVGGELDVATMPELVERVRALVEQGHVRIVLDLGTCSATAPGSGRCCARGDRGRGRRLNALSGSGR